MKKLVIATVAAATLFAATNSAFAACKTIWIAGVGYKYVCGL